MSGRIIDHLFSLQRTPFSMAPIVHSFFAEVVPKERDFLLSYLILPMVLYPTMHTFLNNSNRRSSLRSMCDDPARLVGLAARVEDCKPLTNSAILILAAEGSIKISDELSVETVGASKMSHAKPSYIKAAKKLAFIFSDVDVVSIFRTLGLKSL
ncbi:hypothetical protein FVF58_44145 [Paraburkholderia panacisoli]|uniref:Uncharacterized protein n=1 Tax=Paraburkholderia panacisoli TaxID=2603818 RepID=A0A5B0G7E7_9BURK|nr:three component ABC system middle component [Paraburkholderia panacisoli]KAA0998588.1 hypothetical protein FVF58_44145 [Paraburkholderia panacisoli]